MLGYVLLLLKEKLHLMRYGTEALIADFTAGLHQSYI